MPDNILICAVLIAVTIICLSCGDIEEIPVEAPLETYIISGPDDGSVVTEPSVSFQFHGANKIVKEFSYRCSPLQENWSLWSSDTSITLNYLDQGNYVFEVKGRYEPGNEDNTPARVAFTVNFPGPGLIMKPLRQKTILGQEFNVEVVADDVEGVMLAHLILSFDPSKIQAIDVTPGSTFQDVPPAFFKAIDNLWGSIDISISTIGATPLKISGTGTIIIIKFKTLTTGESSINFDSKSEFRDSSNKTINITTRIGSIIEITEAT